MFCSNCGSKKIKGIYLMSPTEKLMYQKNNNMLINAPENINYYACSECDYYGPAIEIKLNNYKKIRANLQRTKHIQKTSGKINENPKLVKSTSLLILTALISGFAAVIFQESVTELILGIISAISIAIAIILIIVKTFRRKN